MKRREFLAKSFVGVGGLMLGTGCLAPAKKESAAHDPFAWVHLGKTGIKATRLGFGTGMRGGNRQSNQTRLGQEEFEALLQAAYERGVRLFDAADLYGTHPYIARALKQIPRKEYVLASKIWWRRGGLPERDRPDADVVVERFLQELNTDYIDIVQLHCVAAKDWPDKLSRQMEFLEKLKSRGVVRAHGVSCHSLEALQACVDEPWVDVVHARINPYGQAMDGPAEKVAPVLEKLHNIGKAVVGMKLIGEGKFRNSDEKRDESIRYVLDLGCVDVMIVGFEKVQEIDDFASRVRKVPIKDKLYRTSFCQLARTA